MCYVKSIINKGQLPPVAPLPTSASAEFPSFYPTTSNFETTSSSFLFEDLFEQEPVVSWLDNLETPVSPPLTQSSASSTIEENVVSSNKQTLVEPIKQVNNNKRKANEEMVSEELYMKRLRVLFFFTKKKPITFF